MRNKGTVKGNYTFAKAPTDISIERSGFDTPFKKALTFNAGKLIPVKVLEMLPGDTLRLDVSAVVRMATPIAPVMDDAYIDIYAFSVARRLVWDHWQEFCGENKTGYWVQPVTYQVPWIVDDGGNNYPVNEKSVADYMGIPPGSNRHIDACYPRGYALIWNEFFRDQNLMPAAGLYTGDNDGYFSQSSDPWISAQYGGALLPVCKYHDYFTSALPSPLKNVAEIGVPISSVPVLNDTTTSGIAANKFQPIWYKSDNTKADADTSLFIGADGKTVNRSSVTGADFDAFLNLKTAGTAKINVSDLRLAFALQRMYEKMARSGTRYRELLLSFFGVSNKDERMQVPERLGHIRERIGMQQVVQTSASNIDGSDTPQGNTAAYSLTGSKGLLIDKSFTEHCMVYILACVRTQHTYQQGINKMFSRRKFTDFYLPCFAHLSEQPIKVGEIYADAINPEDVFGYQEAWAEYRYIPNEVAAEFRSSSSTPLDVWHYADDYQAEPTLTPDWIAETDENIKRTLAVKTHDQFLADFFFKASFARPMPLYSVPGLVDHY